MTGVKLEQTPAGLNLILTVPSGGNLQVLTNREGSSLTGTIQNAQLQLANAPDFQQDNPSPDIAKLTVQPGEGNNIQIRIVGATGAPQVQFLQQEGQLTLALTPTTEVVVTPQTETITRGSPQTAERQGDDIEIVVTDEGSRGYFVPNASTATRTNAPITETPLSIQVVPQQVLRDQQVINLQQALTNVSGVRYDGAAGGRDSLFSIRGFSEAPVLRDGFRLYGNFQGDPEVSNLERIEVLKGPSSTLYGQIEPGGLINLILKKPEPDAFYRLNLGIGNRNLIRPSFDINSPITKNGDLLYRIPGVYSNQDSFRDFDNPYQRYALAPVLRWKISDRTQVDFLMEYINDTGPADFGLPAIPGGTIPDIPFSRVTTDPSDTLDKQYISIGYNLEHKISSRWKLNNAFRNIRYDYSYSVVALPIVFVPSTGTLFRFFADQDGNAQYYSLLTTLTGVLTTGPVKHTLIVGFDMNCTDQLIETVGNFSFPPASPLNIFNPVYAPKPSRSSLPLAQSIASASQRLGIFIENQSYLLKNLTLLAGIRFDTIRQTNFSPAGLFFSPAGVDVTQEDEAFTPRVGILYKPVEMLSLYANYSQYFVPNFGANTASGNPLPPERGEGYEFGIKLEPIKEKLLLTLAYFDIKKQNVAVGDPINPLFSQAIGEQRSSGFEFDIAGEILPGWKIIAYYGNSNARVTEDTNPLALGSQLPGVPFNSASLWTTYEIQTGSLQGLGFGIGFNFAGDRKGGLPNSFEVPSYAILNAALSYRRDKWSVGLNFRNLTNVQYIEAVGTGTASGNYPGEPFTVIGSLSYQF